MVMYDCYRVGSKIPRCDMNGEYLNQEIEIGYTSPQIEWSCSSGIHRVQRFNVQRFRG